jgi:hypothetical protein
MLETIIECRSYAAAKRAYDSAEKKTQVPRTPMVQKVIEIEFSLVQARRDAAAAEAAKTTPVAGLR